MNLSDYMRSERFNEMVRAHIEQQFEQEKAAVARINDGPPSAGGDRTIVRIRYGPLGSTKSGPGQPIRFAVSKDDPFAGVRRAGRRDRA